MTSYSYDIINEISFALYEPYENYSKFKFHSSGNDFFTTCTAWWEITAIEYYRNKIKNIEHMSQKFQLQIQVNLSYIVFIVIHLLLSWFVEHICI